MEDQERIDAETGEDVEGHGLKKTKPVEIRQSDGQTDEAAETEDDVELHRRGHQPR